MPKLAKIIGQVFPRANQQIVFSPESIGEKQQKMSLRSQMSYKKFKGHMLVSETSAAAFPLARFHGLARVSGVAHP